MSDELFGLLGLDPDDPEVVAAADDDADLSTFLRTLYEIRNHLGLSQKQVAERMGTTQSAVSDLERTAVDPRLSTLQRYARAVGAAMRLVAVPVGDGWNGTTRFVARTRIASTGTSPARRNRRYRVVVRKGGDGRLSA